MKDEFFVTVDRLTSDIAVGRSQLHSLFIKKTKSEFFLNKLLMSAYSASTIDIFTSSLFKCR